MDEAGNGEDTLTNPLNIDSMRAFRDNNTSTDEECSSDESSDKTMPSLEARESTDEDENEEGRRGDPEEPFFMEREDDEDDDEASPIPVVEAPADPSPEDPSLQTISEMEKQVRARMMRIRKRIRTNQTSHQRYCSLKIKTRSRY